MLHDKRLWCVSEVETAEELARQLTEQTWVLCNGATVAGYPDVLFVNDSTSEDAVQEYAVLQRVDEDTYRQLESITMGWCSFERALKHINAALSGKYDESEHYGTWTLRIETPDEHRRQYCPLCR